MKKICFCLTDCGHHRIELWTPWNHNNSHSIHLPVSVRWNHPADFASFSAVTTLPPPPHQQQQQQRQQQQQQQQLVVQAQYTQNQPNLQSDVLGTAIAEQPFLC
ncbi:Hap2p [Saccharomyces cerevisiae Vin13]|nr:Hap2p [Saccharomyces cerevisiae Vin13]